MGLSDGLPRCRHTHIVREWELSNATAQKLQHCEWCGAARLLRDGKWSRWRVLPINAVPHGPAFVLDEIDGLDP